MYSNYFNKIFNLKTMINNFTKKTILSKVPKIFKFEKYK